MLAGEWHYSDLFSLRLLTPGTADYIAAVALRNAVLDALIFRMPPQLRIAVRTPEIAAAYASASASAETRSRVTQHNDCFLASTSDYGTYVDYRSETSRLYFETLQPVGGETCNPDPNRAK